MQFSERLISGRLLRRYKRFFADVELDSGELVTAHCANPGSMLTCLPEGGRVWLSPSSDPKRKLKYTWQLLETGSGWAMVNQGLANDLVAEALRGSAIEAVRAYPAHVREVAFGSASRIDFALYDQPLPIPKPKLRTARGQKPLPALDAPPIACWLEVKNATYQLAAGKLAFPDSVTERGTKHLRELITATNAGQRAILLFHAARTDCTSIEPADLLDREYGRTLRAAVHAGVEVLAYRLEVGFEASEVPLQSSQPPQPHPVSIRLGQQVPVHIP